MKISTLSLSDVVLSVTFRVVSSISCYISVYAICRFDRFWKINQVIKIIIEFIIIIIWLEIISGTLSIISSSIISVVGMFPIIGKLYSYCFGLNKLKYFIKFPICWGSSELLSFESSRAVSQHEFYWQHITCCRADLGIFHMCYL